MGGESGAELGWGPPLTPAAAATATRTPLTGSAARRR